MALFSSRKQEEKIKVTFGEGLLFIEKENGKQQAFPLEWYPALQNATEEELADWDRTDKGIHFNALDVDIPL